MARRQAWDGEIDDLPAEILSFNIKEIPRSTLKDIANRLNADTISAGNWESLAEKLGFTQNSVLDNLTQQAKVQNTYPGLLMLQEWSRRSGSTAHVLLHALREILREDAVGVLVDKLRELHTMQLLVNVQDGEGPPKFLRVTTQKSAPLHASLDNTLQKPPYWYDIVGPRYDINWNTPSGVLQGTQLSLRQRVEPNENSMSEIYGTTARLCQPPPSKMLAMNIPPEHFQFPEGKGQSVLNNLSHGRLSSAVRDENSQPPPSLCFPQSAATVSRPAVGHQQRHDAALFDFETMTSIGPPRSDCAQQFPNFDTLMSSAEDFQFMAPPVSMSSLLDHTDSTEYHPSSCTGLKTPVIPLSNGEYDETLLKERVNPVHEKMNISVTDKTNSSHEDAKARAVEHDEMALPDRMQFTETIRSPVTASSLMHPVYVAHDRIIQFCNNPTSPQSLHSNSSSVGSAGGTELPSTDSACVAVRPRSASPNDFRRMANGSEYVPVKFIEQQSQSFEKSEVSSLNEEESMQTEYIDFDCMRSEKPDDFRRLQQKSDTYSQHSAAVAASVYSNMDNRKPKPCTYTKHHPGVVNSQQYTDFQPRPLHHSVSLDNDLNYMDMTGSHMDAHQPPPPPTSSAMLAGIHSSLSVDSYMDGRTPDFDSQNANVGHMLDNGAKHFDPLLHSRSRNPFPVAGDVFQPRDRRPLTQDHELLLDDPESEYTYIDAVSVLPPADFPRGSSEEVQATTGAKHHGTDRSVLFRDSDSSRRNSSANRDRRGSVCLAELEQVPGWNANITERSVEREMSRYINDDGNFIVWRYAVRGKFVISVSHLRSIRHYAIYESEREGKVFYYIFPKGARFTTLTGLILHCQKHGVAEPTKTFRTPDGKQTHRSSGRFSHVRLKFPIPAQQN